MLYFTLCLSRLKKQKKTELGISFQIIGSLHAAFRHLHIKIIDKHRLSNVFSVCFSLLILPVSSYFYKKKLLIFLLFHYLVTKYICKLSCIRDLVCTHTKKNKQNEKTGHLVDRYLCWQYDFVSLIHSLNWPVHQKNNLSSRWYQSVANGWW